MKLPWKKATSQKLAYHLGIDRSEVKKYRDNIRYGSNNKKRVSKSRANDHLKSIYKKAKYSAIDGDKAAFADAIKFGNNSENVHTAFSTDVPSLQKTRRRWRRFQRTANLGMAGAVGVTSTVAVPAITGTSAGPIAVAITAGTGLGLASAATCGTAAAVALGAAVCVGGYKRRKTSRRINRHLNATFDALKAQSMHEPHATGQRYNPQATDPRYNLQATGPRHDYPTIHPDVEAWCRATYCPQKDRR